MFEAWHVTLGRYMCSVVDTCRLNFLVSFLPVWFCVSWDVLPPVYVFLFLIYTRCCMFDFDHVPCSHTFCVVYLMCTCDVLSSFHDTSDTMLGNSSYWCFIVIYVFIDAVLGDFFIDVFSVFMSWWSANGFYLLALWRLRKGEHRSVWVLPIMAKSKRTEYDQEPNRIGSVQLVYWSSQLRLGCRKNQKQKKKKKNYLNKKI